MPGIAPLTGLFCKGLANPASIHRAAARSTPGTGANAGAMAWNLLQPRLFPPEFPRMAAIARHLLSALQRLLRLLGRRHAG